MTTNLSLTEQFEPKLIIQYMPLISRSHWLLTDKSQWSLQQMSAVQNMYMSKDLETTSVKDVAMHNSPNHLNSTNMLTFEHALTGQMQGNPPEDSTADTFWKQLSLKQTCCSRSPLIQLGSTQRNVLQRGKTSHSVGHFEITHSTEPHQCSRHGV